MSDLTKITDASFDMNSKVAGVITLVAGSAINSVAPCYINSDGKIYMAAASGSVCDGFSAKAVSSGQPVTIFGQGAIFSFAESLTPGAKFYLSTTAGSVATTATNSQSAIAKAIDTVNIIVL